MAEPPIHYRQAPYCAGSGQFRTACHLVLNYQYSTLDRSRVDCPACRASKIFQETEEVFGPKEETENG